MDVNSRRVKIFGLNIDNLSLKETVSEVSRFVSDRRPRQHVVVNVDKVVKAHSDFELCEIINKCDLVNADGMPIVWASRILGFPLKERVAGIDLFYALLEEAAKSGWRVFFLGAREEVVSQVVRLAGLRYPGLQVAGMRNGYWRTGEDAAVAEQVRGARPDILFVAISSPMKEQFLGRWRDTMNVPFSMGVGGSFDVFVGLTKRAPLWMQRLGLEWFYRFLQEPRRMFRRYFIEDALFFVLVFREVVNRLRRLASR